MIYFFFSQGKPETTPATSLELINAESPQQTETPENENPVTTAPLMIDMKGQVVNPGVYELPAGSRMQDAIDAAGGFTADADSRAINLALIVMDETSLYVPAAGEEFVLPTMSQTASAGNSSLININLATEAELMELPGIGPSKATAILTYRDEAGSFKTPEELMEVTGIGDKTFEQLKDLIIVK
ncbi:late competence protein ComEA [Planococcus antarcticus DSM 14505]|uniref:Competence protein ComEA n=1 Tax=Planococcus antarcticus DSM 14505 TaxID=1185653 RepID=A0A1C7DJ53_9BACL|nr:helix-hairpin-helix domain-containing protein [Planococcus antarcticus]ANU11253.1 competence protein ComEA [Planococcus antarcticus DSM 14505]EIM07887.1 late competence protein ComEA [Planococcus antarcticus DSM 14505]